jgi:hypothetical protein
MCSGPVGLGAKRTRTFLSVISIFLNCGAKIKEKMRDWVNELMGG